MGRPQLPGSHPGNADPCCVSLVAVFACLPGAAALYESWVAPLAGSIVPMCMLSALAGVKLYRSDNNTFVQSGLRRADGPRLQERSPDRRVCGANPNSRRTASSSRPRCKPAARLPNRWMTSVPSIAGHDPAGALRHGAGAEVPRRLVLLLFAGHDWGYPVGLFLTPCLCRACANCPERKLISSTASQSSHG